MATKLNDKQIKSLLRKGEAGRFAAGNGLYFRVSNEKTGFWVLRYTIHGRRRELSIGRYPEMPLVEAAAETALLKAQIRKGFDPIAERKRSPVARIQTVNELAEDWLKNDIEKRLKHPHIPRRIYTNDLAPHIGDLSLDQVTPLDVRHAIETITSSGRPTVANDALGHIKQLFRHGIRLDVMKANPAEAFTVHHAGGIEESRKRSLSVDELCIVFKVFRDNPARLTRENYLALALLLMLGVRKGELIAAKWEEFNTESAVWNIPSERSKTGVELVVPLPDLALSCLEELHMRACGSEYVFPARRASKRRAYISDDTLNHALAKCLELTGVDHFTVHDLRRTCRSLLASVGVPSHVAERCLNHKLKGVEAIYDRYDYLDERRDALQKVADLITPFINPASTITSFRSGA